MEKLRDSLLPYRETGADTSKDGRVTYDVFLVVDLSDADAQSSIPMLRRQNQPGLSLDYDLPFGLPRQKKSGCRPKLPAINSGGAQ